MAEQHSMVSTDLPPDRWLDLRGLLEDLLAANRIVQRSLEAVLMAPRPKEKLELHPLEFIAEQNVEDAANPGHMLDLETLTEWLSTGAKLPHFRLDPLKINPNLITGVMSYEFAQRHRILAVEVREDEVVIASCQPYVHGWRALLQPTLPGKLVTHVVINPEDLRRYTLDFYVMARSVSKAQSSGLQTSTLSNLEQMLELGQLKSPDANDAHIVNIVDWFLQYAFDQRASDIHIEPRREKGNVRFRIDGVLHEVYHLPAPVMSAVTARLKILGRMDVAEKRRPQDGRLKTKSPEGNEVELRLSTLPTAFGEKMVLRIFDPDVLLRSFPDLGLANEDLSRWLSMVEQPNGIVLVTGPTGSGKTTTLYSTLKKLATKEVNVCTIEDPIEMVEGSFNQMQVQHNIDLSFASGVRALLRQDPDIIMVGEIRDLETAEMAIQAALTGHLVLSTLHTNDAPTAVTRMLELGVPAYLIKATVLGIMAQRLVRTLCRHCKHEEEVDVSAWDSMIAPYKATAPGTVFSPTGCLECRGTGYRGRAGLYELLRFSDPLRELVDDQVDLKSLRALALREGMRTLRLSGAHKVGLGITTIEEVLRVAPTSQMS